MLKPVIYSSLTSSSVRTEKHTFWISRPHLAERRGVGGVGEKSAEADFTHFHAVSCSFLTNEVPYPQRPFGRRRVAAQEVHGNAGESDADADQRVDGVTVERHDHQEDGQEAEQDGVHEAELEGGEHEAPDWQ